MRTNQIIRQKVSAILVVLFLVCPLIHVGAQNKKATNKDWPIIVRKGDQLYEGDKPFRFLSFAAPNIQQNESQIRLDRTNRFPDEYEIRDILQALHQLGGRATRTFSLSIYSPEDNGMPVYIEGRRKYNEEAFQCLDRIIALCHEYDVRVIVPFIASQSFPGIRGVDEFSALAGKPKGSFWTDPEQKEDFKHLLHFILTRVNTVNGIPYKDDPAILAWQLGNEFGSYYWDRGLDPKVWEPIILEWSLEMAAYIKKIDPNHLVMEAGGCDKLALINEPNIDVISEHLYEYWNRVGGKPWQLSPYAIEAWNICKGRKPLMIDEFGLGSYDNIKELIQTIVYKTKIVGGLMWSIRGHRRDGGWYYHNEGGTPINSFHYPGFAAGYLYDEIRMLELMRHYAFIIRDEEPFSIAKPTPAPVLFKQGQGFTWRGSTGAAYYTIERAESPSGPWKILATGLHDSVIQDVKSYEFTPEASEPTILFYDETKATAKTYYYRIKGSNIAGDSDYSDIIKVNW
ncbi:MAG: hypothetical protein ACP5PZ_07930 [Bacteroidales bacterium]